ncbi:hypothetical protein TRICI_006886 [Trichomonascus ciferrii]|uniref:Vta1 C-terminal domain-containing protein n=1 Tax=Trichomonascus ciferrii TaxID=44093 RepID=A0A6A1LJN5_9ASCO|nr:hypothetical protein TRICI_006886 [Trichomonascus ciferrii]
MNVPESVKFVQGTLARGKELEKRDPVISYYCKLHAVQQILGQNLHQSSSEVAEFSSGLLDEVEQFKNDALADEKYQSIINDEQTAQVYVENFALKVFAKADNEVREQRSTRATPTTFLAAAVFLDTLKVFQSPLEAHVQDKIKYAKFHAARILKALKAGEDPNLYEPPKEDQDEVDALEQELGSIEVLDGQEKPAEEDQPAAPQAPAPAQPSSFLEDEGNTTQTPPNDNLGLPEAPPVLPKAPADAPIGKHGVSLPSAPSIPPPRPESPEKESQPQPHAPPAPAPAPAPPPTAPSSKPISKQDVDSIVQQSNIISEAQKRAKYAISALNYEDVDTATSELQSALNLLAKYNPQ